MRLEPLCEMELAYQDLVMVHPYGGNEGTAFGTGEGTVSGERIRGTVRWVNHPHHRSDDTWLPDARGVIKTDDEANIMFGILGRTTYDAEGVGRQLLTFIFEAEDERYAWLNTTWCVAEGVIGGGAMHVEIYTCINELV